MTTCTEAGGWVVDAGSWSLLPDAAVVRAHGRKRTDSAFECLTAYRRGAGASVYSACVEPVQFGELVDGGNRAQTSEVRGESDAPGQVGEVDDTTAP